jgi:F-type H+-transporting ATPase subunit delta
MATRMQVAELVATQIRLNNRTEAVTFAAAWLSNNGKRRQAAYLAKDVAWILERNGYVLAKVTTSQPLSATLRSEIVTFVKSETAATEIEIDEVVDPSVMGGLKIETPSKTYDKTVLQSLNTLVRGVV